MNYEYKENDNGLLERRAMQGRLVAGDWEPAGQDCPECNEKSVPVQSLLDWGRCQPCEYNIA